MLAKNLRKPASTSRGAPSRRGKEKGQGQGQKIVAREDNVRDIATNRTEQRRRDILTYVRQQGFVRTRELSDLLSRVVKQMARKQSWPTEALKHDLYQKAYERFIRLGNKALVEVFEHWNLTFFNVEGKVGQ